jgi:hypothetical protein
MERALPWDGVHGDAAHAVQPRDHTIRRCFPVHQPAARERRLVDAEQPELMHRQKPFVVFGAQFGDAVSHHVDDRAGRIRRVEAAADAEVDRKVVRLPGQHARAPGGGGNHADARRRTSTWCARAKTLVAARRRERERPGSAGHERRELELGGRDEEKPHARS